MSSLFKQIFKQIKKYNNIVIVRHTGPDPDALGAQLALRDILRDKFRRKNIYALGNPASRFKHLGTLDKLEDNMSNTMLIVLDTPDIKRIDGVNLKDYDYIIKIDHHPFVEAYADIELIDDTASSTCQILLEMFLSLNIHIKKGFLMNI